MPQLISFFIIVLIVYVTYVHRRRIARKTIYTWAEKNQFKIDNYESRPLKMVDGLKYSFRSEVQYFIELRDKEDSVRICYMVINPPLWGSVDEHRIKVHWVGNCS